MAKPSKTRAKRKKVATPKKVPAPTYLNGTDYVDIPMHRVVEVLKMIHEHGHATKFKKQAKQADLKMRFDPKAVNFVKDFVANNDMHSHAVGRQVVNSAGTYDCTSD